MPGKSRKQSLPGPGHKSWPAQTVERTDVFHTPPPVEIALSSERVCLSFGRVGTFHAPTYGPDAVELLEDGFCLLRRGQA